MAVAERADTLIADGALRRHATRARASRGPRARRAPSCAPTATEPPRATAQPSDEKGHVLRTRNEALCETRAGKELAKSGVTLPHVCGAVRAALGRSRARTRRAKARRRSFFAVRSVGLIDVSTKLNVLFEIKSQASVEYALERGQCWRLRQKQQNAAESRGCRRMTKQAARARKRYPRFASLPQAHPLIRIPESPVRGSSSKASAPACSSKFDGISESRRCARGIGYENEKKGCSVAAQLQRCCVGRGQRRAAARSCSVPHVGGPACERVTPARSLRTRPVLRSLTKRQTLQIPCSSALCGSA